MSYSETRRVVRIRPEVAEEIKQAFQKVWSPGAAVALESEAGEFVCLMLDKDDFDLLSIDRDMVSDPDFLAAMVGNANDPERLEADLSEAMSLEEAFGKEEGRRGTAYRARY